MEAEYEHGEIQGTVKGTDKGEVGGLVQHVNNVAENRK